MGLTLHINTLLSNWCWYWHLLLGSIVCCTSSFEWFIVLEHRSLHDIHRTEHVKYSSGKVLGIALSISPLNFSFNTWKSTKMSRKYLRCQDFLTLILSINCSIYPQFTTALFQPRKFTGGYWPWWPSCCHTWRMSYCTSRFFVVKPTKQILFSICCLSRVDLITHTLWVIMRQLFAQIAPNPEVQ